MSSNFQKVNQIIKELRPETLPEAIRQVNDMMLKAKKSSRGHRKATSDE